MESQGSFASRLREARETLRFTLSHCASALGVSVSTWKRWEAGTPMPSDKLAELGRLGFDGAFLLFGAGYDLVPISHVSASMDARRPGVSETAARYDAAAPWAQNLLTSYGLLRDDAMCEPLRGVDTAADGSPRVRNALASVVEVYSKCARELRALKLGESIEKLQSSIKPTAL